MLQMCWPVIMFESFLSTFKIVNISKYNLIEEQSSTYQKGEYLVLSCLREHTAV